VVAAVTVSGPNFRISAAAVPDVSVRVIEAAAEISQRNGQPKPG
jgi:IclR family transcriptional regulator, acetate operon repressor